MSGWTPKKMSEAEMRKELRRVAKQFTDAAVERAIQKWKEDPENHASQQPHEDFPLGFHLSRLFEEVKEVKFSDPSKRAEELLDVGNFAAWAYFRASRYAVDDYKAKES